jgi:hypothetical protein
LPKTDHVCDLVQVLEDWEAQQDSEPSFEIEANRIGEEHLVRVTFPSGETETIYGFVTRADAIKWIRCEAVVWLYERRRKLLAG